MAEITLMDKYREDKEVSLEKVAKDLGYRKPTAKQVIFANEYLIDLNGTQAAIRAGYSENSARQIASENLSKPYIREYIAIRLQQMEDELIADQTEVMKYLTSVMRREKTESIVITSITERAWYEPDKDGKMRRVVEKRATPQVVEIPARLCDANKAAEQLHKAYGTYVDLRKLDIEERKLQIDEAKAKMGDGDKSETGVVLLTDILEDSDEGCIDV